MKNKDEIQLAVIAEQIITIKEDIKDIKEKLNNNYVTSEKFDSFLGGRYKFIEMAVLGIIGLIVTAVIYSLLGLLGIKK